MNTRRPTRSVVNKTTVRVTFALLLLIAGCFVITFRHSTEASLSTNIPPPNEGASLPHKAALPANSPQVTDFAQDVQVGLLGRVTEG